MGGMGMPGPMGPMMAMNGMGGSGGGGCMGTSSGAGGAEAGGAGGMSGMGGMGSMAAMGMGGMGGMPGMGMMPMMQMVPMVPMMPMAAMAMGAMNAMNCMPAMAAMANMGAMGSTSSGCDATKRTKGLHTGGSASCSSTPANAMQAFSHVELQERLLKARCAAAEALPSSMRERSPSYHHRRRRDPSPQQEPQEPPPPAPPHQQHDATSSRHRDASLQQDSLKTDEAYLGLQPLTPGNAPLHDDTDVLAMTGEKPLEAAKKAALEIKATLEKKHRERESEPPAEVSKPKPPGGLHMGVVIHWSEIRGFGILRSQAHGEIFVHAKSLVNATELVVGDIVTFELGFDRKKQKPEAASNMRPIAVNCLKAGADACRALHTPRADHLRPVLADAMWSPEAGSSIGGTSPVDDAMLASAAAAAAKKLLAQGMGGAASADGEEARTRSRPRRSSPSLSRSSRRGQRHSSRGRSRRSRSRSRQGAKVPRQRR